MKNLLNNLLATFERIGGVKGFTDHYAEQDLYIHTLYYSSIIILEFEFSHVIHVLIKQHVRVCQCALTRVANLTH